MPLDPTTTANDIVAKIKAKNPMDAATEAQCKDYWTDIITALYNRIKADAQVTSTGPDPQGGAVSSTGTVT